MRLSAFTLSGLCLTGSTLLGAVWWLLDDGNTAFGFGVAGVVAVGLGWAAHGPTVLAGAGRAALFAVTLLATVVGVFVWIVTTAFAGDFFLPFEVYRNVQDEDSTSMADVVSLLLTVGIVVATVGVVAGVFGAAARGYAESARDNSARLVVGGIALAPLLLELAASTERGVGTWTASCALSIAWLVWALRRARDATRSAEAAPEVVALASESRP